MDHPSSISYAPASRDHAEFATLPPDPMGNNDNTNNNSAKNAHDINYILGPSNADRPSTPRPELAPPPPLQGTLPSISPAPPSRPHDASAASLLPNINTQIPLEYEGQSIQYTPTTHRISKAKKGKKVHVCEFGCGKVFTRAEHRKRHEANHRSEPLYKCHVEGCYKPFQRLDLLNRHLERQHGIGPSITDPVSSSKRDELSPMGPPPKRPHSSTASGKNDWNTHKATIERLYITENRPLKDIKVHMEQHFGFTPVEDRAYEKAFRRLGLSKNIPAATMEAILRHVEQRSEEGKKTTVYWRGQRVDEKRIHRFKQRLARENKVEKLDPNEFLAQGRTFSLPDHVRCVTPSNNEPIEPHTIDVGDPESSDESGEHTPSSDEDEDHPRKHFGCPKCEARFSSENKLIRHKEGQCPESLLLKCPAPDCKDDQAMDFESHDHLWKHMVEKHQMK